MTVPCNFTYFPELFIQYSFDDYSQWDVDVQNVRGRKVGFYNDYKIT